MEAFFYLPEYVENARYELTRYYYTAISAHGTYILSVFIGIFTSVQAFHYVNIENEILKQFVASILLGSLSTLVVYFVGRIFVYTKKLYWMRFIRLISYDGMMKEFGKDPLFREYGTVTPMLALEHAVRDALDKNHKRLMECFAGKYQTQVFFGMLSAFAALVFLLQFFGVVNF